MCKSSQPTCLVDVVGPAVRVRFDAPLKVFTCSPAQAREMAYLLERFASAASVPRYANTRAPLTAPHRPARDLTDAGQLGHG